MFLLLGLAALWLAFSSTKFLFGAIAGALLCFLLGATALSRAGRLATSLRPFRHRTVRVRVWGTPIPGPDDTAVMVDSVMALSAALLIQLRSSPDAPRTLLKVAQPGRAGFQDGRIDIESARYVSFGGKRLAPAAGHPAVTIVISTPSTE